MYKPLRDIVKAILSDIEIVEIAGKLDIPVSGLAVDSRKVKEKNIFFAIRGTQTDGHQFIAQALENGAIAVVCQEMPENQPRGKTFIQVKNPEKAMAFFATTFFENPSQKLRLVGVTGTNGKTTIATLLHKLFTKLGFKAGLISTITNYIGEEKIPATHTTPDTIDLNSLLRDMAGEGCQYCFMEVSSHALVQHRTANLSFAGGIFTNITHDHLDYHKTFDEYIKAKKSFFDALPKKAFALVNTDDRHAKVMLQNTAANKYSFALKSFANFKSQVLESHFEGTKMDIDGIEIWSPFVGFFNAQNFLAAYAAAILLGQPRQAVLEKLTALKPVEGRFEIFRSKDGTNAVVDYAHTPDALKNVLQTIVQIKTNTQKLLTVVGAGGNRDKSKRPQMAKIAAQFSSQLILTSDNPRNEKPEDIIDDMKQGLEKTELSRTLAITDRREAIRTACTMAEKGDIVLVAGKGHETYQEIKGVRNHFDDREIVKQFFEL